MCWIKVHAISGNNVLINISAGATNTARMTMRINTTDSKIIASCRRVNADSVTNCLGGTALSVGGTYHLAFVANYTSSRMDLYINGVSDGSTTSIAGWGSASDSNASAGGAFGGRADGGAGNFADVTMQHARFYQRPLTAGEVLDAYNGGSGGTAARNIWDMLTTSGTASTITDTGAGGNNGTGVASPTFVSNIFSFGACALTGGVGDMALDGDSGVDQDLACDGVVGTCAIDGDRITAGALAAIGSVGTLGRPATKDGGLGSSTLLGLGATTSVAEHYNTTRLSQDPAFTFENLGESNYTTWHLLPTGSPAPPSVPSGTLASPDAARNVTALIAAGVTRAVINVNSDIFRLATVHNITSEAALKAFFDAYILPNYWTIYTALEAAGITTIVCAIQPRDTTGGTAATRATEAYAYTKMAAMFGARFVGGFYTYLVDVDGTLVDALTSDTTHPNDSATTTLAGYWVAAFDAIDGPGENFGDAGADVDLACTGTVGTAAIDADAIVDGALGATGVAGVCAISGGDTQAGTLACTGSVGTAALEGDAWTTDLDLACTGSVGTCAIDGDVLTAGGLNAAGSAGTCSIDGDPLLDADVACAGVAGVCEIVGRASTIHADGVVGGCSMPALVLLEQIRDIGGRRYRVLSAGSFTRYYFEPLPL